MFAGTLGSVYRAIPKLISVCLTSCPTEMELTYKYNASTNCGTVTCRLCRCEPHGIYFTRAPQGAVPLGGLGGRHVRVGGLPRWPHRGAPSGDGGRQGRLSCPPQATHWPWAHIILVVCRVTLKKRGRDITVVREHGTSDSHSREMFVSDCKHIHMFNTVMCELE